MTSLSEGTVETRLRRLEDVAAIQRLKAEYCAACDSDHDPDAVAALFHPDATWEASSGGPHRGTGEIHRYFAELRASGMIRNSAHNVMNPIIDVDGDRATGHWRLIMLYTVNGPDGARYLRIVGWYRDTFRRGADGWRFDSLYCEVEEHAPYAVLPGA